MGASVALRSRHGLLLCLLQLVFIGLFAALAVYHPDADETRTVYHPDADETRTGHGDHETTSDGAAHSRIYPMFQDVHVMIFIGFGFLMTFLKRYGLSSVSVNFLVAGLVLEWAILVNGLFHLHHGKIQVDANSLLGADFTAAAVLISFGVVLGKTSPSQLIVMALLEVPIFVINEVIGRKYLMVTDMGDSMFVHAFGAYFGLAVSFVLYRKDSDSDNAGSSSNSDLFSMIGTLFLWCFWPSFNSALAVGDDQHRAVINTYLSLAASCVTTFAVSALFHRQGKFTMEHVQNATLAGGVAIGTAADMAVQPVGALIVGTIAGAISVVGFEKITPALAKHCRVHDTCGVHNLHGLPGVLAGVVGAVLAALATEEQYHSSLYVLFPAMAPASNSSSWEQLPPEWGVAAGSGRSAAAQGGMQMLALVISLIIGVLGGALTGLIMRLKCWDQLQTEDLFSDRRFFVVHCEDEPEVPRSGHTEEPDTRL
ncbi:ammonium transporter Rh type A-like [Amphibalanus amphitrite]|uniref:ammonium transporter Rh type A-like n=1 Tax=Amphibalanus amphitrite TaxID=1232801 RepID=UPI001C9278C7|nr:ammonium transporter Rh type A-like [Amphibalanus amphitrite]